MSKVFISYAHEDRNVAERLANSLTEQGIDVWWDYELVGGSRFRNVILNKLDGARKVIVLWSAASTKSDFVLDEANRARSSNKLVPISIDGSTPPLGFGALHTLSIVDIDKGIELIVAAIDEVDTSDRYLAPPSKRAKLSNWFACGGATLILMAGLTSIWPLHRESDRSASQQETAKRFEKLPPVFGFEFNSDRLTKDALRQLDEYLPTLRTDQVKLVRIHGHVAQVSPAQNIDLSSRRADSVGAYIEINGVDRHKIRTWGFGASQPLKEAGNPYNSRVEIEIEYYPQAD